MEIGKLRLKSGENLAALKYETPMQILAAD